MANLHLPRGIADYAPDQENGCKIVLDYDGGRATIVVPYAVTVVDGKITGQSIALVRFDLATHTWGSPVVLDPSTEDAGRYLKTSTIVGYFGKFQGTRSRQVDGTRSASR